MGAWGEDLEGRVRYKVGDKHRALVSDSLDKPARLGSNLKHQRLGRGLISAVWNFDVRF